MNVLQTSIGWYALVGMCILNPHATFERRATCWWRAAGKVVCACALPPHPPPWVHTKACTLLHPVASVGTSLHPFASQGVQKDAGVNIWGRQACTLLHPPGCGRMRGCKRVQPLRHSHSGMACATAVHALLGFKHVLAWGYTYLHCCQVVSWSEHLFTFRTSVPGGGGWGYTAPLRNHPILTRT